VKVFKIEEPHTLLAVLRMFLTLPSVYRKYGSLCIRFGLKGFAL